MIKCINITHSYGKRLIYKDLSFTVPKGKILGLLGKNGTGKTTTINILSGFLKPQSGECRIFGENILTMPPERRQRIGLLIENHVQYSFMTIREIERFYSRFYPAWNSKAYYEGQRLPACHILGILLHVRYPFEVRRTRHGDGSTVSLRAMRQ